MRDEHFKQEVVSTFNRAAHLYGQVGVRQFSYFGELLVDNLAFPEGAQILDVASGRGRFYSRQPER